MDAIEFIKSQMRTNGGANGVLWALVRRLVIKNPKLEADQRELIKEFVASQATKDPHKHLSVAMQIATYIHSLD